MGILKSEIEARIAPENVRQVQDEILSEKNQEHNMRFWVVADEDTGDVLEVHSRLHVVTEEDLLNELNFNREQYGEDLNYVVYEVPTDEFVVMRQEMVENAPNANVAKKKDPRFNQRTFKGRRRKAVGQNPRVNERLGYTPPTQKKSMSRGKHIQPEFIYPGEPEVVIASRVTSQVGAEVQIDFSGEFTEPAEERELLICFVQWDSDDERHRKRFNRKYVYREAIEDTFTGVYNLSSVEKLRDDITVVQIVLNSPYDGGPNLGLINRSLNVEIL